MEPSQGSADAVADKSSVSKVRCVVSVGLASVEDAAALEGGDAGVMIDDTALDSELMTEEAEDESTEGPVSKQVGPATIGLVEIISRSLLAPGRAACELMDGLVDGLVDKVDAQGIGAAVFAEMSRLGLGDVVPEGSRMGLEGLVTMVLPPSGCSAIRLFFRPWNMSATSDSTLLSSRFMPVHACR